MNRYKIYSNNEETFNNFYNLQSQVDTVRNYVKSSDAWGGSY